jgi:sialic acid synthase SpsE
MTFAELGIEPGQTKIVVEAGNCRGDIDWALEAVEAAADSEAVFGFKGQIYSRERLTTKDARTYGKALREPRTQWDNFEPQLTYNDWADVAELCEIKGLEFFASVFDLQAIDFCEARNVNLYKIASADITHQPLIQHIAATGKPIILSTGGATLPEIQRAMEWIAAVDPNLDVLPMMCTLSYPTPPEEAHLARLVWWRENVGPMVGYSDHTAGISAMLSARELGAVLIEKHFTITPGVGGDHDFAVTPQQLDVYHDVVGKGLGVPGPNWEKELGDPHIGLRPVEGKAINNARRSIAAAVDIPAGSPITAGMLSYLRPGTGAYEPWQTNDIIGLAAPVDIPAGTHIPLLGDSVGGEMTAGRATISANLTVE